MYGFLLIVYQAVIIPYRLCFEAEAVGVMKTLELIIDICFMLDIIVSFNTGYYQKGNLVLIRRRVIFNYLRTWFLLDLLASFPWSYVLVVEDDGQGGGSGAAAKTPQLLRLLKSVRFLRFVRLVRVLKLKKLLYKMEEYITSDIITTLIGFSKIIIIILFIGHWIGCIFYAIGLMEYSSNPDSWIIA